MDFLTPIMNLKPEEAEQQLTVISYGIGQDSTWLLFELIHNKELYKKYVRGQLIVVNADTLNEHKHTITYREYVWEICFEHNIPFFVLDPAEYANGAWKGGLINFYEEKKAVGSKAFPKQCTDNLKIRPIYRFLEQYVHIMFDTEKFGRKAAFYEYKEKFGKIRVLIGIAAGEERRASTEPTGLKWFDRCIEKVYPLIENNMDREACQRRIAELGYKVPFPSNCILCPFMSYQELLYLYRYNRPEYDRWVRLEKQKIQNNLHKGEKNLGVWGTRKLLPEILKIAEEKHGHMTKEELEEYKFSHGHCVMSKY